MNTDFEYYKAQFEKIATGDIEAQHGDADSLICDIAISAAQKKLTVSQVKELIIIYNAIEKWYA